MKKLSLLLGLIISTFVFGQKKEDFILKDEPQIVTHENIKVKFQKHYDKVLVSLNAIKPNTVLIYKGVLTSTVDSIGYSSYHHSDEGWKDLESSDKSSGYLDYNNFGILELTITDLKDIYKVYVFSSKLSNFSAGIVARIDKL